MLQQGGWFCELLRLGFVDPARLGLEVARRHWEELCAARCFVGSIQGGAIASSPSLQPLAPDEPSR